MGRVAMKCLRVTVMIGVAILVGGGIVYAYDPGAFSTLWVESDSDLEGDVSIGTSSSVGDLTLINGNITLERDNGASLTFENFGLLEFQSAGLVKLGGDDGTDQGIMVFGDMPEEGDGGLIFGGPKLFDYTSATTDYVMYCSSDGVFALTGDTGALVLGDYSGDPIGDQTGASLYAAESVGNTDPIRAAVHVAATGGGALETDPIAVMSVSDSSENEVANVTLREDDGEGEVALSNEAGSSVKIETKGDVVITLGSGS